MSTAVVWFRRDLRVHDHPPLVAALREHDEVVPLFVLDPRLIGGRFRVGQPHAVPARLPAGARRRAARPRRAAGGPRTGTFEDVVRGRRGDRRRVRLRRRRRVAVRARPRPARGRARRPAARAGQLHRPPRRPQDQGRHAVQGLLAVPPRVARAAAARGRSARRRRSRCRRGSASDGIPALSALGFDEPPDLEDRPEPGEAAALKALDAWARAASDATRRRATRSPSRPRA